MEVVFNATFCFTLPITYSIVFSMQKRQRRPDLLTSSILRLIEHLILGGMLIFWLRRPKPICFGLIKFLRILLTKAQNPSKFEELLLIPLKNSHHNWIWLFLIAEAVCFLGPEFFLEEFYYRLQTFNWKSWNRWRWWYFIFYNRNSLVFWRPQRNSVKKNRRLQLFCAKSFIVKLVRNFRVLLLLVRRGGTESPSLSIRKVLM